MQPNVVEGDLKAFLSIAIEGVGKGAIPFPGLLHLPLIRNF